MYKKALSSYTSNYFLFIPLSIILQSCIGSIAAILILMQGVTWMLMLQLSLVVFVTGFYNGGLLAQLPISINFKLLLLSLVVNLILIVVHVVTIL